MDPKLQAMLDDLNKATVAAAAAQAAVTPPPALVAAADAASALVVAKAKDYRAAFDTYYGLN